MKKLTHDPPSATACNRRRFFATAAIAVAAKLCGNAPSADAQLATCPQNVPELTTGNGEWTYRVLPLWGELPAGESFGGTHGAIATDQAGRLYVSTQSETGVLVYDSDGKLLRSIATDYPEVHSMTHALENNQEYFYATVQKGTPRENWLCIKMKPDGTVIQKITAPPEAGFTAPNQWRLTAAVCGPDGSN